MRNRGNIIEIVLLVFVLLLIVERCNRDTTPLVEIQIDTLWVTKTDTITKTITEVEYKEVVIYRDIPQDVDTFEILKDYFAVRYYERDIDEEKLKLVIRDSISENKLIWDEIEYTLYTDTIFRDITKTKRITEYRSGFYGNLGISTRYISPGISYMNKKGYQIGIGIHISGESLAPHLHVSVPL